MFLKMLARQGFKLMKNIDFVEFTPIFTPIQKLRHLQTSLGRIVLMAELQGPVDSAS